MMVQNIYEEAFTVSAGCLQIMEVAAYIFLIAIVIAIFTFFNYISQENNQSFKKCQKKYLNFSYTKGSKNKNN